MWNAKLYEDRHSFVWKYGASLVELLAPKPDETILDLGCGTGQLTAQIAAAGASVRGIDSSPAMVEEARHNYPDLSFAVQDARNITVLEPVDAVFSNAVLHWVKEPEAVARGVARALKPGGRFVAEFGGRGNVRAIVAALQNGLRLVGAQPIESPWYYPGVAEYASVLERAGLEVTFATLFDRPTHLEGSDGMRKWVEMFGERFLQNVPDGKRPEFLGAIEEELRPTLFREGAWYADYRRLRIVASK